MARRKGKQGSKLRSIVTLLVAAVAAFCILSSYEDKHGGGIGLPALNLPSLDFIQDFLDEFHISEDNTRDNAMAVSSSLPDAKLEVHILDMGQADSILIKGPSANILIDAGETNQGQDVIRYLRNQGVSKLQYVIGTHPHSDHIGGMDTVIREMRVEGVILPVIPAEIDPTTQTYTDLLLAIGEKGLKITPAKPGKTYNLGDGAQLRILGPIGEYSDLNNMSVTSRLTYGTTSFLFTGDQCTGAESDVLTGGNTLRSDVLDIGHHGSKTSTSEAFLQAVNPRIATISCGLDNSYGHPHREVMERLQARNIQILRTDLNGVIVIASDGERLGVSTQK